MKKNITIYILTIMLFLVFASASMLAEKAPTVRGDCAEIAGLGLDAEFNININLQDIDERITIGPLEAYKMFQELFPRAKINEIELEFKDDRFIYEVEGYEATTEYELKIDAFTGEILEKDIDKDENETGHISIEDLENIGIYVEKALADSDETYKVVGFELETKRDYLQIEVKLKDDKGNKIKYKFDANTGELLEKERD